MIETIQWHKYPEEKPEYGISRYLCCSFGHVEELIYKKSILVDSDHMFYRHYDEFESYPVEITHWACMPQGPINSLSDGPAIGNKFPMHG